MLNKICNFISMQLVINRKIDMEEKDKFRFGLEVILSQGVIFSSMIVLSLILNQLAEALLFIWVFGSLRQISSGYHAVSFYGCYCLTFLSFLLSITLILIEQFFIYLTLSIAIVLLIILFFYKKEALTNKFLILFTIHLFTFFFFSLFNLTASAVIPNALVIVLLSLFFNPKD